MSKYALSITQLQYLRDLGFDISKYLQACTLADILDVLLTCGYEIRVGFSINTHYFATIFDNNQTLYYNSADELIDAAYGLLCWAIENGYV